MHSEISRPTMTKPNSENCKNCSSKCAHDCAQLQYTIQHRTVLIISPLTSRQPSQFRYCLSEEKGLCLTEFLKRHIRTVTLATWGADCICSSTFVTDWAWSVTIKEVEECAGITTVVPIPSHSREIIPILSPIIHSHSHISRHLPFPPFPLPAITIFRIIESR